MCNQFAFHHQFRIDTGKLKNLSNRQTVFFLPVDPMEKNHKDRDVIDLSVPRHAQHMHKAWKRHQNAVYCVDINLALRKRLKFYQTRSNAIILHETLPAYCIPKDVRMETGSHTRESIHVTSASSKDLLETRLEKRIWVQIMLNDQKDKLYQPIPNPSRDRMGQPVVRTDGTVQPVVETNTRTAQDGRQTSGSQEIDTRSFHEEAVRNHGTGQSVENRKSPNAFI